MDLDIYYPPEDLMTKFMDCLVLLPNLKTLEIFSTSPDEMLLEVKRRSPRFSGVCELVIGGTTVEFLWRCPNVESLTIRGTPRYTALRDSRGKKLKKLRRVAGVRSGVVGHILVGGIYLFATHRGSCAVFSGPPRDLHQG